MDVRLYGGVKVYDGGVAGGTSCCLNAPPDTSLLIGCSRWPVYATLLSLTPELSSKRKKPSRMEILNGYFGASRSAEVPLLPGRWSRRQQQQTHLCLLLLPSVADERPARSLSAASPQELLARRRCHSKLEARGLKTKEHSNLITSKACFIDQPID